MKIILILILSITSTSLCFSQIGLGNFTVNGTVFEVVTGGGGYVSPSKGATYHIARQGSTMFNLTYVVPTVRANEECVSNLATGKANFLKVYDIYRTIFPINRANFLENLKQDIDVYFWIKGDGTIHEIFYSVWSTNLITQQEIAQLDLLLKQIQFSPCSDCRPTDVIGINFRLYFKGLHTDPSAFGLGSQWEGSRP